MSNERNNTKEFMPLIINDIECTLMFHYKNKEDIYCIGSKSADQYFWVKEKMTPAYMNIIRTFDGEHTIADVKRFFCEVYDETHVDRIYDACLKCGFIANETKRAAKGFNELKATYKDVATINIDIINNICGKISNKIFSSVIMIMFLTIIIALLKVPAVIDKISWDQLSGDIRSLIYAGIVSTISVILHELFHAIAASKSGLNVSTAKIATFTYITFACYIKLPGIYFLKPSRRLMIWGAGIFLNLFLIAISLLRYPTDNEQGNLFLMVVILSNISIILSALIPFYISDGYYMLSTIFKAPNLRKDVFKNIKNLFSKERISFQSYIYMIYFFVSIIFMFVFVLYVIGPIILNIYSGLIKGISLYNIVWNNKNVFLVVLILFLSRIVRKCLTKVKQKGKEKHGNSTCSK